MSKVAHYLQEHLVGEVMTGTDARNYFSTDSSILQLTPALVVYPKNENDVRKTARFCWQLAERGRVIPITPRGSGTDQTGAALGEGIMLVFPAHMNHIIELDNKNGTVTVEAGINYGKLQQALHTHGSFIPPYPASVDYSTIGGAIGNNLSGEKSVKYGDTREYVRGLRVVLANGEVIDTKRLSKREHNKKLGLASFEGEIYRSLDTLIEEEHELIEQLNLNVAKNNAGYALSSIKRRDGSFDLTPLLVGSQGTLGIITEATLGTEPYNPDTTLMMALFDSLEQTQNAVLELLSEKNMPSAIELVDENVLKQINDLNPNLLGDVIKAPYPPITLLVEFENGDRSAKKSIKKAHKALEKYARGVQVATEPEQQQAFWKVRQASSVIIGNNQGLVRAVPLFDASVPPDRFREYLEALYALMQANNVQPAVWGHAGESILHLQPKLNLGQVGDRQKAFRLLNEYHKLVVGLGGTISAEAGDGRLKAPYLEGMYGPELYGLLNKVKQIFDPYGTLNPGVKFGSSLDDVKALVRNDYGLDHLYDHLPRS